jgi:tRNA A37 threonylcarbamoyladenosine dehydratase
MSFGLIPPDEAAIQADLERRFAGLRRLYGDDGYLRLRALRLAVVGLGGVGSWVAEALARCGVAALVLIDMDHVAESNINRQLQALGSTLGQGKGQALRDRIADIHPACEVHVVDDFVTPANWPALLPVAVHGLVDACDQMSAKAALAAWALEADVSFVTVGAAGGKRHPQRVEVDDLAQVTHDPLLASLRQRLRRGAAVPRTGAMGVRCVFSREPVLRPAGPACEPGAPLACHGYGSSVMVTASFAMSAATAVVEDCLTTERCQVPVSTPRVML